MRRTSGAALAACALIAPLAFPLSAHAGPVVRALYFEEFEGSEAFSAGSNWCVDYAGTLHEVRSGSFELLAPADGPRSAEVKVRVTVAGQVAITPASAADGPSYTGSYSERAVGWISDLDSDTFRVGHYSLRGRLQGSDGSSLVLQSTWKVTLKPDGTAVVERQATSCT